jgi:hypothetical protein
MPGTVVAGQARAPVDESLFRTSVCSWASGCRGQETGLPDRYFVHHACGDLARFSTVR